MDDDIPDPNDPQEIINKYASVAYMALCYVFQLDPAADNRGMLNSYAPAMAALIAAAAAADRERPLAMMVAEKSD